MKFAVFQAPFTPPERTPRQVFKWTVNQASVADQAGLTEYWVGEHATLQWESVPNPELVLAAAALETENIKLCPGAHLLPYHHPGSLAVQVSWMSHLLEGRYILGIAAGAFPSDAALRGLTDLSQNHRRVVEALDIMERIWKAQEFHFEGEFWDAGYPGPDAAGIEKAWRDLRPYGGSVEIGIAGLSLDSPSLRFAGTRGFIPLSIFAGPPQIANHWALYSEAAAAAGQTADRSRHHVVIEAFVADTDEEAKRLAIEGGMGRAWQEYLLPSYKRHGLLKALIPDPAVDPMKVTVEYLADNVWFCGSPDTVAEKISRACEQAGGAWGTTMIFGHDFSDNPEGWNRSLQMLVSEVGPRLDSVTVA